MPVHSISCTLLTHSVYAAAANVQLTRTVTSALPYRRAGKLVICDTPPSLRIKFTILLPNPNTYIIHKSYILLTIHISYNSITSNTLVYRQCPTKLTCYNIHCDDLLIKSAPTLHDPLIASILIGYDIKNSAHLMILGFTSLHLSRYDSGSWSVCSVNTLPYKYT